MMTSTLSTSTSFRTALTASPGVPLLSAKYASTLRPMMPPLALVSSTIIVAPHTTPSPVIAEGPLIAEAKPTRMGGPPWAQAGPAASTVSSNATTVLTSISSLRDVRSPDDGEVLARAGQPADAGRRHLYGILDLHAAPAVLVVRRLDTKHHAWLERRFGCRVEGRRIIGLETDPVPDVVALVVGHPVLTRRLNSDFENSADRYARLHRGHPRLLAGEDRRIVARQLVARLAEHSRACDVRAVALVDATEIEAHHVAGLERSFGRVDVGERSALTDRDHGEEGLSAALKDLRLVHIRCLALGDTGFEHREDGGHAILGDLGGALKPRDLRRALHHARAPEELVGGHERRTRELLLERAPG